jgi:hypothetical protein
MRYRVILAMVTLWGCAMGLQADPPSHAFYRRAVADLREARWNLLAKPGKAKLSEVEKAAVQHIQAVLGDLKATGIDDSTGEDEHPSGDESLNYGQHLHKALDLLKNAHQYLNQEQDGPESQGLKRKSIIHLGEATKFLYKAIYVSEHRRH